MPQSIDWPPPRPHRRRFFLILIALAILFLGSRAALSYYVEILWFRSLGYVDVFWKSLRLEWDVFIAFAVATFVILYGSFLALKRAHLADLPDGHTILIGGRPVKLPVEPVLRIIALGASLAIALATGAAISGEWMTLALFWYAPPSAGQVADPIFGKPLGFFLFTLPAWQLVLGWLLTLAVIAFALSVAFVLLSGGARALTGQLSRYVTLPWRGVSITLAILLSVVALRVYVSRFERLLNDHTIFAGVNFTDAHVAIPGLLVVCVALALGAIISLANAVRTPGSRWLIAAVVPGVVCYIGMQMVSWYVSNFVVKPNELVREKPYIVYNTAFTRQAFGLDRITPHEFPAEATAEAIDAQHNQVTLQNIRLWDWHALQDTLRQIQEIRTYYDFPDIDIDRYDVSGTTREVMLAARELNVDKLPESSRNWINEKLIYTHGYGLTMNPVNGFTPEGLPTLLLSNMPVQSTAADLNVTRPEIYFGELTNTDVYVKTRQQEFNYPQGQTNNMNSYEGTGGIVIGGFLRRLIIAIDRNDLAKLPFSDDVNSESRLLMRRNIRDRVAEIAPFLTYDPDPYIVLGEDGRLSWILDAFTLSDSYPDSTHYPLGDNLINYLRNSVKVVIDAYNGTTTFYVFDPTDPIAAAYRRIFPTLFKDASAMPADLRKHVRYPELLLKQQADVYGLYHMTDAEAFYNREDLWTVATEVGMGDSGEQTTEEMQPNFVLMKLPGEPSEEFVDILPFTPANRNNLIGWIAGRSDGTHYGTSVVYDFPKTKLVDGPLQVEARIDQNAQLSGQLTLWNQQGSHVRRGTLLVIPSGKALLYAEPIYLQAQRSPMPELRLVVLALQDRLAYGPTFESAMTALFGGAVSSLTATGAGTPEAVPPSATSSVPPDRKALIGEAAKDLADYQRLTAEGKLGEAGQKLEDLKHVLERLNTEQK
ncbi:MAG TPA: UPF0182 family protein [Verrucomicrobiae bacterium]|nr:UPF0182 family protein [Verrucomicrobiae bacterium]